MKIAICLSGHIRTYEKTFPSLYEHFLSRYDCDIFIATYPTMGSKFSHLSNVDGNFIQAPINIIKIKELYNPIDIIVADDILENSYYNPKYHGLQVGQFKIIKHANDLKKKHEENGANYDAVLRLRPDIEIIKFDLSEVDSNCMNIPRQAKAWPNGICDQLAISSSHNMNIYSEYYSNIDAISKYNCGAHPEIRLKKWIDNNNIAIKEIDIRWNVLRLNGSKNEFLQ